MYPIAFEVIHQISRSHRLKNGQFESKLGSLGRSQLSNPSDSPCCNVNHCSMLYLFPLHLYHVNTMVSQITGNSTVCLKANNRENISRLCITCPMVICEGNPTVTGGPTMQRGINDAGSGPAMTSSCMKKAVGNLSFEVVDMPGTNHLYFTS